MKQDEGLTPQEIAAFDRLIEAADEAVRALRRYYPLAYREAAAQKLELAVRHAWEAFPVFDERK